MESWGGYLLGVVILILSVFLALSPGASNAVNAPVSIGINIANTIGVNCMGADQWVEISNEGTGSVNLTGWTLMDIENQTCSFPANFVLKPGSIVRVHSRKGNNTATDLYNSALVWKRTGDAAILKDATGKIVSEYGYPTKVPDPENVTKIGPLFHPNTFSNGETSPTYQAIKSDYNAERGSSKSNLPVNLNGHPFICHGGPLNWAWTTGLK